jgi:nucleotide-binding universal stress UspA family protein
MQISSLPEGVQLTLLTISKDRGWENEQMADALFDEARLKMAGFNLTCKKRKGKFANQVAEELKKNGYDLLLLQVKRPRHPLPFRGADPIIHIADRAPCSLLLLNDIPEPFQKILLCDSGLDKTRGMLDYVIKLIRDQNGEQKITVLHVMSQIVARPGIPGNDLRSEAEKLIDKKTPEGKLLQKDLKTLKRAGFHTRPKVRHGLVVDEILAEAKEGEYDLVVIGAHQTGKGQALLLDNIAKKVIRNINRPLLVVNLKKG